LKKIFRRLYKVIALSAALAVQAETEEPYGNTFAEIQDLRERLNNSTNDNDV